MSHVAACDVAGSATSTPVTRSTPPSVATDRRIVTNGLCPNRAASFCRTAGMPTVLALGEPPREEALAEAARVLAGGLVVALPTDTVYGVAVDPTVAGALGRLFATKGRPREVAVAVLVADGAQATSVAATLPDRARRLVARFWPGGLTVVVARRPGFDVDLGGDPATVGVRCPAHDAVRDLCRRVGPLAVTSANRHGEPTPATAHEVAAVVGDRVALVLDGGECAGAPSTVVDCTGAPPALLREGAISWREIYTTWTEPG